MAVIAQIRTLTVQKRRWLNEFDFAEGFALAQSLPGTAAGNIATYVGLKLRGWRGASVAMGAFILPSTLLMIVLGILYRHLRHLPETDRLFHGLNAAVVALIAITAWRIGKNTLRHRWQWIVGVLACLAVVALNETVIEVVLAAGLVGIFIDASAERRSELWRRIRTASSRRRRRIATRIATGRRQRKSDSSKSRFLHEYLVRKKLVREPSSKVSEPDSTDETIVPSTTELRMHYIVPLVIVLHLMVKLALLLTICAVFLRIGSITFGGGFAMIPLMESEAVDNHHWLTHQEFADATALGQITPGPVLISATFIGYRVAGVLGALLATISIFLPSFMMTIVAGSSLRRFSGNRVVQSFLAGVTPAVVGLLVAAAISIGRAGIHTFIGIFLALLAGVVLIRWRPNAFWVIAGAGVLRYLLGKILW
jgi:chromate transporter